MKKLPKLNEEKELKKLKAKMNPELESYVGEILNHPEFLKRKQYHHHEDRSVYVHSLNVCIKTYKMAKFFHADKKSAAIAGLLHDFYYKDWQLDTEKRPFFQSHGFRHPKEALDNSKKYFPNLMNKKIENSIVRHMFPLTLIPPRYGIGWMITLTDKAASMEILKYPSRWYKYLGIKKKEKK